MDRLCLAPVVRGRRVKSGPKINHATRAAAGDHPSAKRDRVGQQWPLSGRYAATRNHLRSQVITFSF